MIFVQGQISKGKKYDTNNLTIFLMIKYFFLLVMFKNTIVIKRFSFLFQVRRTDSIRILHNAIQLVSVYLPPLLNKKSLYLEFSL